MSSLYLARLPVSLPALARWAASRNYGWTSYRNRYGRESDAGFDEGRAVHHLLTETFGPGELQPFRMMASSRGKLGYIYAYSKADAAMLQESAQAYALPEIDSICNLSQIMTKVVPDNWRSGRRLGFEIRVRPVKRLMKPLSDAGGKPFAKGAEVDAFVIEALRRFPEASSTEDNMLKAGRAREMVYADWLSERLDGAATLEPGVRLAHFLRRRAARTRVAPEGPDATLQGNLIVSDPVRFQQLLANGLGRHKAYGYGMLLLRPPRRA